MHGNHLFVWTAQGGMKDLKTASGGNTDEVVMGNEIESYEAYQSVSGINAFGQITGESYFAGLTGLFYAGEAVGNSVR